MELQVELKMYLLHSTSAGKVECNLQIKSDLPLMAKPKPKHIPCDPEKKKKKKKHQGDLEVDPLDQGNWMVVKKQRVTILIPPLPGKVQCTMPNVGEGQLQGKPGKFVSQSPTKTNSETQPSLGISALKQSVHEKDKSISLCSPEQAIPPSDPNLTSQKPSSLSHRSASYISRLHSSLDGRGISICRSSKLTKGMIVCVSSNPLLDRRMRAIYLDKKIKKAGGLENWLFSVGLTCFVNIFQKKKVNKFQLASLTMKKLQDMGAYAVGPRRKLMHAIECLCESHCFQHV